MTRGLGVILWLVATVVSMPCWAGNWELGGAGGFGLYRYAKISAPDGSARIGFGPRFALGAVMDKDFSEHLGAEFRYTLRDGDLELTSGGEKTALDALAHTVHADLLVYPDGHASRLRPLLALGGGFKFYSASELPVGVRPLQNFAALNKASQIEGLISLGGGIKYSLTNHWLVRLDFRDYITPFPEKLVSPAPGTSLSGRLNDFVPMVGVSYVFAKP